MKRNAMNDKPEKPQPPEQPAGPESGALIEPSDEAVARLEGELADMKDKYLRLAAEYDNFKKRSVRERTETWQRAQADLVQRLVDALDDLARFAHADPAGPGDRVAMAGRRRTGERGREVDGFAERLLPDPRRVRDGDDRRDQEGVSPSRQAVPPRS